MGGYYLKKLYKVFATVALLGVMTLNPASTSANHGGSNWQTHYSYDVCIDNNTYLAQDQHRHIGPNQEFRTIYTFKTNACRDQ